MPWLSRLYLQLVFARPRLTLLLVVLFALGAAWSGQQFRLDASSDSLMLESDRDLRHYRAIRARYGADDFLVVTYSPEGELFSERALADLGVLRDELLALGRVESVTSILDVPLLDSPRTSLNEMRAHIRTLEEADTDRTLARREFLTSPLYADLLLSPDGRTTALQVNFRPDPELEQLLDQRVRLQGQEPPVGGGELAAIDQRIRLREQGLIEQEAADVVAVRTILDRHRAHAELHLGGVPMIVSDMIDFIRSDIRTFGIGVALFLVLLLGVAFKRPRWVLMPMAVCGFTVVGMVGFLGMADWPVTVVSSNFISLLLIITLSLTVHLIVRHEELHAERPDAAQPWLLRHAVLSMVVPSFYTALTTMVAFGSLLVSDIRPVIDFGWMMVIGVAFAFVLAFLLFPALISGLPAGAPIFRRHDLTGRITRMFAGLVLNHGGRLLLGYLLLVAVSLFGLTRLTVENSFIDYFKESTEIHQGMLLVDRELGGTIPLDVVIGPDRGFLEYRAAISEEDEFALPEAGITGDSYWFNVFELDRVAEIHAYLAQLPQTGKVLSMATTMELLRMLNHDRALDNMMLSVMFQRLPDRVREALFDPYMSKDGDEVRFVVRVVDSGDELRRDELLRQIRTDLIEHFGLEPEQVRLSGMLVLYNNVLQSLFRSQIATIGVVFLAIAGMFLLLFRTLRLALLGVIPTAVAAAAVLGLMGLLGIPLDIMTITIAAIAIGIGVDDTIHYLHRFRVEFAKDRDYRATVHRCHLSVGRALYYTSVTITLGFSILALSNFIPTIYFGLLTGVAMVVALIANLTLLPLLILRLRPLGAGAAGDPG